MRPPPATPPASAGVFPGGMPGMPGGPPGGMRPPALGPGPMFPGVTMPPGPGMGGGMRPMPGPGMSPLRGPSGTSPRHARPGSHARSPSADSGREGGRSARGQVAALQARLTRLESENAALHEQLSRRAGGAQDSWRAEVLQSVQALETCVRDAEEAHARLFSQLRSVTQALVVKASEKPPPAPAMPPPALPAHRPPDPRLEARPESRAESRGRGASPVPAAMANGGLKVMSPMAARPAPSPRSAEGLKSVGGSLDAGESPYNTWFLSMKQNLEHFGDVEVFIEDTSRECNACFEMMVSPYRIKPKKCPHVFHIECLLQWWTEGTCPVCRVSFAPEGDAPARPPLSNGPAPAASHVSVHSSVSQKDRQSPRGGSTPMKGPL